MHQKPGGPNADERQHFTPIAENRFWRSFHFAFEGIIYAVKTQVNLRIHLVLAVLVLMATLYLRLQRVYLVMVAILIGMVLAFEILNTAIEAIVDLLTLASHPLAKVAKDAAAGAVLVVSLTAALAGYLIFYEAVGAEGYRVFRHVQAVPAHTVFIALVIVAIGIIFAKAYIGRGSPLQGGAVSGHAALAFACATLVFFYSRSALVAGLAFFLAFLVGQSRVEAGIHSAWEVVLGGVVGAAVSSAVFLLIRLPAGP